MSAIAENIARIRGEIAAAAALSGRQAEDITFVAAVKTQSPESIREAIAAGIDAVGENRVQELTEKLPLGAYEGCPLHFIGHLQRNKLKKVVGVCTLIESVDSSELARLISERALALGITQDVLIEVNIGGELSKSGVKPELLEPLLESTGEMRGLRVRGLMAIPPISAEEGANRPYFAAMRKLFVDIAAKKYDNVSMDFLSMGMSGDYRDAIIEGSNMIRVGTAIFGARDYGTAAR